MNKRVMPTSLPCPWKHPIHVFRVQYLVHALAALALMGLAGLWLIMNLSAQFAHARRDLQELRRRWASNLRRAGAPGWARGAGPRSQPAPPDACRFEGVRMGKAGLRRLRCRESERTRTPGRAT
jgi:hypothetical protein